MRRRAAGALIAALLLCALGSSHSLAQPDALPRTAKVAGAFYPADADALRTAVTALLQQAAAEPTRPPLAEAPSILILPHAGYPYSGPIAARGFRTIQGRAYDAVVVVGFTHRGQFTGTSVDDRPAYQTPLGAIPVAGGAVAFLKTQPTIHHLERAHEGDEHSLEVMLPFLQIALGDFRLVPLLMGDAASSSAEGLAEALFRLSQQGNYLFIFSSDLSHYHPYEEAKRLDALTIEAMSFETSQAVRRLFDAGALEACGRGPIVTALALGERLGLKRQLLAYANSGDTAGDKSRVVGYAALGFYAEDHPDPSGRMSAEAGMALVRAARLAIDMHLNPQRYANRLVSLGLEEQPELSQARGLFVTLRRRGQLRGCIGRITTEEPLSTLLPTVALESALHDTRFPPVSPPELAELTVEVSILTPPQPVAHPGEIVAGRDGVVLQKDGHSGVFLPQVWHETGWTRVEFLRELASQKAGLDPEAWRSAQLFTFRDQIFGE